VSPILIGTAGFSYKDWEGIVYPRDLKKRKLHPLEYLARFFDCCEINTSFYGHIRPEVGAQWCKLASAVNASFQFTAKLHKSFTHAPAAMIQSTSAATLAPQAEDESLVRAGLDSLAEKQMLGALLIQFPISFKNIDANRGYLGKLIQQFRQYPLVVEVRHSSWDDPAVLDDFRRLNVGFCNIDQPHLGRSLRASQHATSTIGYVRLHGRNYKEWFQSDNRNDRYNYLNTEKELAGWKEKIENLSREAEKTFVVANNHYQGKAAVNALEIKHMLTGKKVDAPETLVEHYPVLKPISVGA
jgi:uncharacterized protein YecE (DUF72 family)